MCVASGVAALWGPAHGGANEAVLKMLEEIGRPENVKSAVDKAKDKESGFRLMGFGHRVYKNYDPRAALVRKMTHEVLGELGVNDPLLEVAMKLEEAALKDEYFVQRKLYPNVDFYSGIIYKALGIPVEMFTVMFAIARTAGWVSHWLEQQNDPEKQDRPPAPDLHRRGQPRLRRHRPALNAQPSPDDETPRIAGRFRFRSGPMAASVPARICGRPVRAEFASPAAGNRPGSVGNAGYASGSNPHFLVGQQLPQLRDRRAFHRLSVDARQRRLAQHVQRQHGEVEGEVLGAEQPHREIAVALAVQAQAAAARFGGDAVLLEEARRGIGIVAVEMQGHRRCGRRRCRRAPARPGAARTA